MNESSHTDLLQYQPHWKDKFHLENKFLSKIFGDSAIAIEHIGSTSIEGLSAKSIVDIAVLVENPQIAEELIAPLLQLGYRYDKENSSSERHLFRKGNPTKFHLSIAYTDRGSFWERQINFRDYLSNHSDVRDEYAKLKKDLLAEDPTGNNSYISGKTDFVNKILELAK